MSLFKKTQARLVDEVAVKLVKEFGLGEQALMNLKSGSSDFATESIRTRIRSYLSDTSPSALGIIAGTYRETNLKLLDLATEAFIRRVVELHLPNVD